jgi:hypothetical protein
METSRNPVYVSNPRKSLIKILVHSAPVLRSLRIIVNTSGNVFFFTVSRVLPPKIALHREVC